MLLNWRKRCLSTPAQMLAFRGIARWAPGQPPEGGERWPVRLCAERPGGVSHGSESGNAEIGAKPDADCGKLIGQQPNVFVSTATVPGLQIGMVQSFERHGAKHVALGPLRRGSMPAGNDEQRQRNMPRANNGRRSRRDRHHGAKLPRMAGARRNDDDGPALDHFRTDGALLKSQTSTAPGFGRNGSVLPARMDEAPDSLQLGTSRQTPGLPVLRRAGRLQRWFAPQTQAGLRRDTRILGQRGAIASWLMRQSPHTPIARCSG